MTHLQLILVPTSNTELSNIANNIFMKSCILDPLPATLLKQDFDLLLPVILKIFSLSLESGRFPFLWKLLFYLHYLRKPT